MKCIGVERERKASKDWQQRVEFVDNFKIMNIMGHKIKYDHEDRSACVGFGQV